MPPPAAPPQASAPSRVLLSRAGIVGVAVLLLSLGGARAQDVRLGVRVGPTFGFLNDSPVPFVSEPNVTEANTNVRLDLHVGVYTVVPLSERFALQPGLLFVQKGTHLSRVGDEVYSSERYRLSYLQGHLLGRRALSVPAPFRLHAAAGPTVGVATGGVVRRDIRTRTAVVDRRIPLVEHGLVRRWDVGLLLGVGVEYPLGAGRTVGLALRYNAGVRTVFTEAERPAADRHQFEPPPLSDTPPPLRHDVIMVSLSFTGSLRAQ